MRRGLRGCREQSPACHFQLVEQRKEGDLAFAIEGVDVIDRELFGGAQSLEGRVERGINIKEAAGLQEMRFAATRFTVEAKRRVRRAACEPLGQRCDGLGVAAGDKIVQRWRAVGQKVENELAHGVR